MSNTNFGSDTITHGLNTRTFIEEDKTPTFEIPLEKQKSQDQKIQRVTDKDSSLQQKVLSTIDSMKSHQSHHTTKAPSQTTATTILRTISTDKIISTSKHGSTGCSQSFTYNQAKHFNLKLNSNLINQQSIAIPQTTSTTHSSRMQNYQNPHSQIPTQSIKQQNSHRSVGNNASQKQYSNNQTQNYTSSALFQQQQQSNPKQMQSTTQFKSGSQVSQGGMSGERLTYSSSLILNANSSQRDLADLTNMAQKIMNKPNVYSTSNEVVKVGTQIPKTTTNANMKNFQNLRQFNQLFNYNKQSQSNKNQKSSSTIVNESDQSSSSLKENQSQSHHQQQQQQQSHRLLQNHQRHLQQQQQRQIISDHKKSQKIIGLSNYNNNTSNNNINSGLINQKQIKPKNLQISIPSSPRNEGAAQKQVNKEKDSQGSNENYTKIAKTKQGSYTHNNIGCQSTTNANQGSIKLSQFTCHSTRNDNQKENIFKQLKDSNEKQEKEEETKEPAKILDMNSQENLPLQPAHKIIIPNHESTKHSLKRNGVVRAYAANTNQGLVRNYNEDRVSIILNILKPPNRKDEKWPRCSFFGIYDGHGGSACADFLRDNLHQFVIKEPCFPSNPKEAIKDGFANAEKKFLEICQNDQGIIDKSGSCAIVALIVEDMCYIANVGDSRAILSSNEGSKIYPLSRDHKPSDDLERKRIIEGGGQIYHRTTTTQQNNPNIANKKEVIVGPLRVLPGRLSVSRTFGDAEAKISKYGGNENVVIATPEIKSFKITSEHDFIVLGCDGIFDKLSNKDTIQCVWNSVTDNKTQGFAQNVHKQSGMGVEYILKNSLLRKTLDNVTVVLIAFNNFKHAVFGQGKYKKNNKKQQISESKENPTVQSNNNNNNNNNHTNSNRNRKENIPPPTSSKITAFQNENSVQKIINNSKGALGINTSQNCNAQGPKTTTNSQLQREVTAFNQTNQQNNALQASKKVINAGMTSNNSKAKHFDFSNV